MALSKLQGNGTWNMICLWENKGLWDIFLLYVDDMLVVGVNMQDIDVLKKIGKFFC